MYGSFPIGLMPYSSQVITTISAEPANPPGLQRWNGSAHVPVVPKRWSGTAYVDIPLKRWNGVAYVDV